jgi:DNA-binding helix-hairpin-helix protein with protein kinase domain
VTIAQSSARIFDVSITDTESLRSQMTQITIPLGVPPPPAHWQVHAQPYSESAVYSASTMKVLARIAIAASGSVVLGLASLLFLPAGFAAAVIVVVAAVAAIFGGWFGYLKVTSPYGRERQQRYKRRKEVSAALAQAQHELEELLWQYGRAAESAKVDMMQCLETLHQLKPNYERERQQLEKNRRANQLKDFLSDHYLQRANIPKVPKTIIATLISYNIESADDLEESALEGIPGVGLVRRTALLTWRRNIELQFRFDPCKGVSPQDLSNLITRFERQHQSLKSRIHGRMRELTKMRQTTQGSLSSLLAKRDAISRDFAQAAADSRMRI